MNCKKIFILTIISSILCLVQCKDFREGASNNTGEQPKYYTPENEGRWIDKSDTHTPIVTFIDKSTIEVAVPFRPTKKPRHYIETIVLMQGERQVDFKKFKFSFNEARAVFNLPDPGAGDYWVVAKCNLHDMWKSPVK